MNVARLMMLRSKDTIMRITARTLLFMLTLPLVGCSIVGQSESSCPGKPNGYVCKGPREVYEITNSKTSLFDGSQDGLDDDEKKAGCRWR